MIGDYHQPLPNEDKYAQVIQQFLENEQNQGLHPIVLIEHNVKSKPENYREGSYLRLLRSYNDSKSSSRAEVVPVDGRKRGAPLRLFELLTSINKEYRGYTNIIKESLSVTGNTDFIDKEEIERYQEGFFDKDTENRFAEQFGRTLTIEQVKYGLMDQLAIMEEELMSKYDRKSPIAQFIVNRSITPLLSASYLLEAHIEEYSSLHKSINTPIVDFIFSTIRQNQDYKAIAPLWDALADSLTYEGDAYLASAVWDRIQSIQASESTSPETLILIGGDIHITNLTSFFTELYGTPVKEAAFDLSTQIMAPEYLSSQLNNRPVYQSENSK
jgi:hypothetical protein